MISLAMADIFNFMLPQASDNGRLSVFTEQTYSPLSFREKLQDVVKEHPLSLKKH